MDTNRRNLAEIKCLGCDRTAGLPVVDVLNYSSNLGTVGLAGFMHQIENPLSLRKCKKVNILVTGQRMSNRMAERALVGAVTVICVLPSSARSVHMAKSRFITNIP